MTNNIKIIIGITLIVASILGGFLEIDNTWHYFGSGVFFGFGLGMIVNNWKKRD